jgi:hypothetical protein
MTVAISGCWYLEKGEQRTDPTPSLVATDAVHLGDGSGKQTSERTSEGSSGEEHGGAKTEFLALVPATGGISLVDLQVKDVLTRGSS